MSMFEILALGAIAGFTVFLGLPLGRMRNTSTQVRSLLNAGATGILLFLFWDVLSEGIEPVSAQGEGKSGLYCIPAEFGWNDLGSWTALHEHQISKRTQPDGNLISAQGIFTLNASGNYIYAPGKFVAIVGINDAVVVETEDALLVTTRANAQDVGKVVKHLDEKKLNKLV